MHKTLIAVAAATVLAASLPAADRAQAMTAPSAAALAAAAADLDSMTEVRWICRHRYYTSGRRCWWRPPRYHWRPWRPWRHHRHWRRWRHW